MFGENEISYKIELGKINLTSYKITFCIRG